MGFCHHLLFFEILESGIIEAYFVHHRRRLPSKPQNILMRGSCKKRALSSSSRLKVCLLALLAYVARYHCCDAVEGCPSIAEESTNSVTIAGLYDVEGYPWAEEIIDFTVKLINNHNNGWFDDVLRGIQLKYSITDAACDQDVAVRAFLNLTRGTRGITVTPPHAILGCRCSGPSVDVSRLGSAENIPICSPAATSRLLSNKREYNTFSRVLGPDDITGQVGAVISLLRSFGWDRISIITTDTPFSRGLRLALTSEWEKGDWGGDAFAGDIASNEIVEIIKDAEKEIVDPKSVERVLRSLPTDNPKINSKVIVLLAHNHHAYSILETAANMSFLKPDTIWIGVDGWADSLPIDTTWMPPIPGYIGVVPFRNLTSPAHKNFLGRLQDEQRRQNRTVFTNLPNVAGSMVDATLALAMALSSVEPEQRRNGTAVATTLRKLSFEGVTGPVEFNENGDRRNPLFTVMTLPRRGGEWRSIGFLSPGGKVDIDHSKICYPIVGCGVDIQSEKYPVKKEWQVWVIVVCALLGIVALVLCIVTMFLKRNRDENLTIKGQVRLLQEELHDMESNDENVREEKFRVYTKIADLLKMTKPDHWTDEDGLVNISPAENEYWAVLEQLRETMNTNQTCYISELSRVQNVSVWSYYVFRKNQMANKYDINNLNDTEYLQERTVWHGTSSLNPDVIYGDKQEGFMLQYSQKGFYGRGVYFAERSGYSDSYSYRVNTPRPSEENEQYENDREMFLVKLLVGRSVELDHNQNETTAEACRSLVTPPEDPSGLKFDAVTGVGDAQTKIHVVYENGRAYPEYLVRYYKGHRDPSRTRFETHEEATLNTFGGGNGDGTETEYVRANEATDIEIGIPVPASSMEATIWMYQGDDGWTPYQEGVQSEIENAYLTNPTGHIQIEKSPWTYDLDLGARVQTNVHHPSNRQRKIQRVTRVP